MAGPSQSGQRDSRTTNVFLRRGALLRGALRRPESACKTNRSGFAIAPILYLLMMAGVAAGVLFSGYSQILRANLNVTNATVAKSDLTSDRTTLSATSTLSPDQTIFCPPRGPGASAACAGAPQKLETFGGAEAGKLPLDYTNASDGSTAKEVGVFAAGAGVKQLDPWGRYYVYCRWENSRASADEPATAVISAGVNGRIETNCDDATPHGDDQITRTNVGESINRASVWQQEDGSTEASFGAPGSKVTVTADGVVEAKGLLLSGTATLANLALTSPLPLTSGGTGADNAVTARANLGSKTVGDALFVSQTATDARTALEATALGNYLFASTTLIAATASSVRFNLLGAGTIGNDVFLADTATAGRAALGATDMGSYLFSSSTLDNVLAGQIRGTLLGASTIGDGVFTAGSYDTALTALGGSDVGKAVFQAGSESAGRTSLGAGNEGSMLFTATSQAHAWAILGLTGTLNPSLDASISGTAGSVDASGITGGAVPIIHGGTSATTASGALDNLFSGDVTPSITMSASRIAANSISSAKLTNVVPAGTYNLVEVDTAGRVIAGSYENYSPNQLSDDNGDGIIATATGGGYLYFSTASQIQMTLSPLGYLGLGTTDPQERLHVNDGNIRISGDAGDSRELQFTTGETDKRWVIATNGTAESGSSAGSNFVIDRVTDGGTEVNALTINRATGNATFAGQVAATGGFLGVFTGTFVGEISGSTVLGPSADVTSPHRADDLTTGLFSPAAATVSIATAAVERLRVTASGSVGIGTDDPAYPLDVSGGAAAHLVHFTGTTTGGGGIIGTATGVAGSIQYNDGTNNLAGDSYFIWDAADLYLGLGTDTPRAAIDAGHLNGAMILPIGSTGQRPGSPIEGMVRYNETTHSFEGYQGLSPVWSGLGGSGSGGFLGVSAAATSPSRSDDVTTGLFSATSSSVSIATGGVERLHVTGTGSVGIGTSNPAVTLDMGTKTDALRLPNGSTDDRPSSASEGMIRFNTTLNLFEGYTASGWGGLSGSGGGSGSAGQSMLAGFPDVIVCLVGASEGGGTYSFPYFLNGYDSGVVYYRPILNTWDSYLVYTAAGAYSSGSTGLFTSSDCMSNGWSIAQLVANGKAFNIVNGGNSNAYAMNDGTAGAPGLYFGSDPNTGFYHPAADTIGFATGGVERMRIDANGALTLKALSANAGAVLDLSGATGTAYSSLLLPKDTTANRPTNLVKGMLRYNTTLEAVEAYTASGWTLLSGTGSGGGSSYLGTIATTTNPSRSDDAGTGLFSATASTVGIATSGTERLRVTGTGSVGIGTTTPASKLGVTGDATISGNLALGGASIDTTKGINVSQTSSNASKNGIYVSQSVGGTITAARTNAGIYNEVTNTIVSPSYTNYVMGGYNSLTNAAGSKYSGATASYNILVNNSTTYLSADAQGVLGFIQNASTGSMAGQNFGVYGTVANSSTGTMGTTAGVDGYVSNGPGFISNAYGVRSGVLQTGAGGSIGTGYGIFSSIGSLGAGATMSLAYGSFSQVVQQGTGIVDTGYLYYGTYGGTIGTKWGLYLDGETSNYLSGTLGIKTAAVTDGSALDLSGATGTAFSSMILPKDTTGNRPTNLVTGMLRYNTTLEAVEAYTASGWTSLTGGGGSSYLGTIATTTNPSRSDDATTGLFSATASTVSIATSGVERLRVTGTGSVGIGTTTPASALGVTGDATISGNLAMGSATVNAGRRINVMDTSTDGSKTGFYNLLSTTCSIGTCSNYGTYNGISNSSSGASSAAILTGNYVDISNSSTGKFDSAYGYYASVSNSDATNTNTNAYGFYGRIYNQGAGTISNAAGVYGYLWSTSNGTVTSGQGLWGRVQQTSGTMTAGYGVRSEIVKDGASGTLTTGYAYSASIAQSSTGTVGTGYLYYGTYSGTIGTKWGLYLTGETANYMSGKLSLATTATGYPLQVGTDATNGNGAFLSAAGVWTSASDKRFKEDVKPIAYDIKDLMKLKPVSYKMKGTHEKQIGFIAQDVATVLPEVTEISPEGRYGLSYGNMVALVVKAVQELKGENDTLRARIGKIESAKGLPASAPVPDAGERPDQSLLYLFLAIIGAMFALTSGLYISLRRRIALLERELNIARTQTAKGGTL